MYFLQLDTVGKDATQDGEGCERNSICILYTCESHYIHIKYMYIYVLGIPYTQESDERVYYVFLHNPLVYNVSRTNHT